MSRPGTSRGALITVCILAIASACATAPTTGVRAPYKNTSVGPVAVVPFYSLASFSLDDETLSGVLEHYEHAAEHWLTAQGFEVLNSRAFQHYLTEMGVWQEFREGVLLRESLTAYFEPGGPGAQESIEILTVRDLARRGKLPATTLLFGELIYHSEGTCRVQAEKYNDYAQTALTQSAPATTPRPCIVSHFQAKLIDAQSGETMWYNRMLRETHSDRIDERLALSNIEFTVEQTLSGEQGINLLVPQPGSPAADDMHVDSNEK